MCGHEGYRQHWHGDDCGCGREEHERDQECDCGSGHEGHRRHYACGCRCCCHEGPWQPERRFWRRFSTRDERVARLEGYLEDLRAEAQAVEERIQAMKAAQ